MKKVYNFSAGPATMPKEVLLQAQRELVNWQDSGTSVMEVSHRGKPFMQLAKESCNDLRKLYEIPENYQILFAQGGARGMFAAIPLNLLSKRGKALYLTSGYWSQCAAEEARQFGVIDECMIHQQIKGYNQITQLDFSDIAQDYDYVHYCPNETIEGIEIFDIPAVGNAVLVADMSSTILSRKIDISRFGVIYAGAQKNLGPAGITLVIIREDLLERSQNKAIPGVWNFKTLYEKESMFNTPPTFAWYLCALIFKYWLKQGGLSVIEQNNRQKAHLLYDVIDQSSFYHNGVATENRSLMNVVFTTGCAEKDSQFVAQATQAGLHALKGHRIVGGIRASIYNAMPIEGVLSLIQFMQAFQKNHSNIDS